MQDGFKAFGKVNGSDLRQRFSISFTDEYGNPEMGIDGGGLFKDFMENIVKEASSQELGLFAVTPNNRLYPNPDALSTVENAVEVFNFFGKMLGKALYEVSLWLAIVLNRFQSHSALLHAKITIFFLKRLICPKIWTYLLSDCLCTLAAESSSTPIYCCWALSHSAYFPKSTASPQNL